MEHSVWYTPCNYIFFRCFCILIYTVEHYYSLYALSETFLSEWMDSCQRRRGQDKVNEKLGTRWALGIFLARVSLARSDYEDFYSPLVSPQHQIRRYPFIHLGGESTVRVKCLAQGHNTMSSARTRSRVQHTKHEAALLLLLKS